MTSPRIVVHGAAGFVAGALLPRLGELSPGCVTLVDREAIDRSRTEALRSMGVPVAVHQACRICDVPELSAADLIISLAGVTDVDYALRNPKLAFDENLAITTDVAEWMRTRAPGARAIFMSTDEVLGETFDAAGESAPLSPTQPYAASKAASEVVLRTYSSAYDLDIVILRSCNLVGGHQNARKLIPVAVRCILEGRPVPVFGDGENRREWLAVVDLCSALLTVSSTLCARGTYHASSGVHLSANEVVDLVGEALGRVPSRATVPDRLVHDRSYSMSAAKLKDAGWAPRYCPTEEIRRSALSLARLQPWKCNDWPLWAELSYHDS